MYVSLMYVQPFLKIALACLIVVVKNGGGIIWAMKVFPEIFRMGRGNQNNFGNLALQQGVANYMEEKGNKFDFCTDFNSKIFGIS